MSNQRRIDRLQKATGTSFDQAPTAVMPFGSDQALPPGFGQFQSGDMNQMLREMQQQMRAFERFNNMPGGIPIPNRPPMQEFRFYYQGPGGKQFYYQSPGNKDNVNPKAPGNNILPGLKVPKSNEIPPLWRS